MQKFVTSAASLDTYQPSRQRAMEKEYSHATAAGTQKGPFSLDDQGAWTVGEHKMAEVQVWKQPFNPVLSLFSTERRQTLTTRNEATAPQQDNEEQLMHTTVLWSDVASSGSPRMTRKSEVNQKQNGWTIQRNLPERQRGPSEPPHQRSEPTAMTV